MTTTSPLSLVESGRERGRLAEVAPQPDHADVGVAAWSRVSAREVPSVEPSSTKTASHGVPSGSSAARELVVEERDRALLVVHGDDDGDHGR